MNQRPPPMNASPTPNILFFTWHDAGDWFGCYGYDTVSTPNVDRLAAKGVRFANSFSACAICSPSRAALMTGRHPQRTGLMRLANTPFDNRIHPHLIHTAKRAKNMGYRTALIGVQHEAAHEHVDEIMGFDECIATDPWPNADLSALHAAEWLRQRAEDPQPFYLQVGTYEAHLNRFYSNRPPRADEPYAPVREDERGCHIPPYHEDNDAGRATVATLQGLLRRGDRLLGTLLDSLEASGQSANTLVVLCVDHGVGLPRAKTTCYDPGLKTGWLLRWPGRLPEGHVVEAMTGHVDVLPTLAELLEWSINEPFDGHSFARHAKGEASEPLRNATFAHMTESTRCIRTERYKLIRNFSPHGDPALKGDCALLHRGYPAPDRVKPSPDEPPSPENPVVELYDLARDPDEQDNLLTRQSHDNPATDEPRLDAIFRDLDARLWDFLLDHDDFIVHQPARSPWQAGNHESFRAHCRRRGRPEPRSHGPAHNPIDAANAKGERP